MIYCFGGTVGTDKSTAYRISKDWKIDEATWISAKTGDDWTELGGDYSTENSADAPYAAEGAWEEYNVTLIIRQFLSGTPDYGILIINDLGEGNSQRLYASSDYSDDTSLRPKLIVNRSTAITYFPQMGLENRLNLKISNNTLSFTLPYNKSSVSINNAKGQIVAQLKGYLNSNHVISLNELSAGVHFLNIKHINGSETIKFIVAQ